MKKNNEVIKKLVENIRQEISSLEKIYLEIEPLIKKANMTDEKEKVFYKRAAGSILHDFYTGIEKIFYDISNKIDKSLPTGKIWHIKLLKKMASSTQKRGKVISLELMEELKEYLGFRHLFRNIYGIQLNWDRLEQLLTRIKDTLWPELKSALKLFIENIQNG